ncbi:NADH dehydrogenase [Raineyella antarctica]|uniref:NADH dehydrogenase n=1 Tax=Raineyella antarctica TaxID=1577474 RepID=A0A1G6HSN4_9ACTN|nr:SDR family oxidoreductase [Raineyella antarctica]SDB97317.1 NADH dehydrogenase [Raineyella antarctica]
MNTSDLVVIVGGTGRLGRIVAARLLAEGRQVRVVARSVPATPVPGAEFVAADVRHPETLTAAFEGAGVVVSAMHGVDPAAKESPESVDRDGNANLIRAARSAGAYIVLMSIIGARPDHPIEQLRMKAAAEQVLRTGPDDWTIVRASAYAELFAGLLAQMAGKSGVTTVFGRGDTPINFVSVQDVALAVARAVTDPTLRGQVIEVGGPENLTMNELASRVVGDAHPPRHVPRVALRVMSLVMSLVNPAQARIVKQALLMDTIDMSFDPGPSLAAHPWLQSTRIEGVPQAADR